MYITATSVIAHTMMLDNAQPEICFLFLVKGRNWEEHA